MGKDGSAYREWTYVFRYQLVFISSWSSLRTIYVRRVTSFSFVATFFSLCLVLYVLFVHMSSSLCRSVFSGG